MAVPLVSCDSSDYTIHSIDKPTEKRTNRHRDTGPLDCKNSTATSDRHARGGSSLRKRTDVCEQGYIRMPGDEYVGRQVFGTRVQLTWPGLLPWKSITVLNKNGHISTNLGVDLLH